MAAYTVTQSIETETEPDTLVGFLADPRHIKDWAPGFADEVTGDAQRGWQAVKDGRAFGLRIVVSHSSRTVDYLREVAPGREGGAYLRVLPRPFGGSVVVMTLPVASGTDPNIVAATLSNELASLARLVVSSVSHS